MTIEIDVEVEILEPQCVVEAHDEARVTSAKIHTVGIIDFAIGFACENWQSVLIGLESAVLIIAVAIYIFYFDLSGNRIWHIRNLFTGLNESIGYIEAMPSTDGTLILLVGGRTPTLGTLFPAVAIE